MIGRQKIKLKMNCSICKKEKLESDFHFRDIKKTKRKGYCKECAKLYRKKYYDDHRDEAISYSKKTSVKKRIEKRQFIWDYLSNNPCIICGESDPIVLEFDHRDPSEKEGGISDMITTGISMDKVILEIKKCDVLCSNCHKRKTSKQYNWYKSIKK